MIYKKQKLRTKLLGVLLSASSLIYSGCSQKEPVKKAPETSPIAILAEQLKQKQEKITKLELMLEERSKNQKNLREDLQEEIQLYRKQLQHTVSAIEEKVDTKFSEFQKEIQQYREQLEVQKSIISVPETPQKTTKEQLEAITSKPEIPKETELEKQLRLKQERLAKLKSELQEPEPEIVSAPKPEITPKEVEKPKIVSVEEPELTIKEVTQAFWKHPTDYEGNLNIIDKAFKQDSADKRKLNTLLESMTAKVIKSNPKDNLEDKIKVIEYSINHPGTNPKLRKLALNKYTGFIKYNTKQIPNNTEKISFLKSKINILENLKNNVSLSEKELTSIYLLGIEGERPGSIGNIEYFRLRPLLKKTNPELFKNQRKKLFDIIEEYKLTLRKINYKKTTTTPEQAAEMLSRPEVIELAGETGYSALLRKTAGIRYLDSLLPSKDEPTPAVHETLKKNL